MEVERLGRTQIVEEKQTTFLNLPFRLSFSAESDAMESASSLKRKPFSNLSETRPAHLAELCSYADQISMSGKYCCMMMRISVDCKSCQTKLRKILLGMKEVETHMIERQYDRVSVCGRFRPSDVAVKVQKRMNRRVWILDIEEFEGDQQPQMVTAYA